MDSTMAIQIYERASLIRESIRKHTYWLDRGDWVDKVDNAAREIAVLVSRAHPEVGKGNR